MAGVIRVAMLVASTYWQDVPGPRFRAARRTRPFAALLTRGAWRVRVHGHHLIPERGPVILASNHTGILDGPLLYSVVRRPVHALVKEEMFVGPLGWALRWAGQIPVDRQRCDLAAVKNCLAVLHRGHVLAVYPEGVRCSGTFERIKNGASYFALCTGAPIVPVVSLGVRAPAQSVDSLPRMRSRLDVVFGRPITTTPMPWPRRRASVREHAALLAERLREHVRYACALTERELSTSEAKPRVPMPTAPPEYI